MSSPRSLSILVLGACLLSGAAQSQMADALNGAPAPLTPLNDITLAGDVSVSRLEVPLGVTLWMSGDLTLRATGDIVIEGSVAALPGAASGRDGLDLTMISGGSITLDGLLTVGAGLPGDAPGVAGGHGGNLTLRAPLIVSGRHLVAGAGGVGGPGANGGEGGDAMVSGALVASTGLAERGLDVHVVGGQGGNGGPGSNAADGAPGGDGGAGGDGTIGAPGNDGIDIIIGTPAPDGLSGGPCAAGKPGGVGGLAVGGGGGQGGPGGDATSASGNGGAGGMGGRGGHARGGDGGNAGDSGGCCFVPANGANGPKGGNGGSGFGGLGGHGGDGGAGGATGVGGDAGGGGQGGNGTGGDGGDGGRGANGFAAGTGGLAGGAGTGGGGNGGLPGSPGSGGLGDGLPSSSGAVGASNNGSPGTGGLAGTFCHPLITWTDTGFGLAGTGGVVPKLAGLGTLAPLTLNSMSLFDTLPNTLTGLFAGFSPLLLPFKSGYIIPTPNVVVTLTADGNGDVTLPFFLPAGLPSGFVFHAQFWCADPAAPQGLSGSNALRAHVP